MLKSVVTLTPKETSRKISISAPASDRPTATQEKIWDHASVVTLRRDILESNVRSRSAILPEAYVLPHGERLKTMFAAGLAIAHVTIRESSPPRDPETPSPDDHTPSAFAPRDGGSRP
jgi:hypothetical protein